MARDIGRRLDQLSTRRRGLDRSPTMSFDELASSMLTESYQNRSSAPYTRYALGSMQEVGPAYTKIGLDEATRVGKQLLSGLANKGIAVTFELQGSVPLNVHIRGASDVDLLTLHGGFWTFDPLGVRTYQSTPIDIIGEMRSLRKGAESVLDDAFPKAKVDKAGSKAIKISEGSLRRAIDVVPSHWHDTADYQASSLKHERGVKVFESHHGYTTENLPFKHIKVIHDRDVTVGGGLKKTIRLCKNVKADAESDGKPIKLSSFEIAGLMWHADAARLNVATYNELSLLALTQQHLDWLSRNIAYARTLRTPDNSRVIIDSNDKTLGLSALSAEIDDLALEVAKEQLNAYGVTQQQAIDALKRSYVGV